MQVGLTDISRKELNIAAGSAGERAALGDNLHRALVGRTVDITPGEETGNAIAVLLQVQDGLGNNLAGATPIDFWLSTLAGGVVSSTAPSSATAVTGGVALPESSAKLAGRVITAANGSVTVKVTQAAAVDYYFNALIDGNIVSEEISFAG